MHVVVSLVAFIITHRLNGRSVGRATATKCCYFLLLVIINMCCCCVVSLPAHNDSDDTFSFRFFLFLFLAISFSCYYFVYRKWKQNCRKCYLPTCRHILIRLCVGASRSLHFTNTNTHMKLCVCDSLNMHWSWYRFEWTHTAPLWLFGRLSARFVFKRHLIVRFAKRVCWGLFLNLVIFPIKI